MKTGIELIAKEREEQVTKHGYTPARDIKENNKRQLRVAAADLLGDRAYILEPPEGWDKKIWQNMTRKKVLDRLIIAGALIAAEIDRIQNSRDV